MSDEMVPFEPTVITGRIGCVVSARRTPFSISFGMEFKEPPAVMLTVHIPARLPNTFFTDALAAALISESITNTGANGVLFCAVQGSLTLGVPTEIAWLAYGEVVSPVGD